MKRLALITIFIALWTIIIPCFAAPNLEFELEGIEGELLQNVTTKLQAKAKSIKTSDKEEVKNFYQKAPEEITKILKLYGYFKPTITAQIPYYENDTWEGNFIVETGPSTKITQIELKILGMGDKDQRIIHNLSKFPLKEGKVFQVENYNTAKQFLFDLADEYGYVRAFLADKEIQIDLDNNTAKIKLHLNTGPKYYFGKTSFNTAYFSEPFLRRFIKYRKGEQYSSKKIHLLQESLGNSNFFQRIDIKPHITDKEPHEIPVEITLTRRKLRKYSFGAGFGTDTGIRGSAETEFRYLTNSCHSFKGLVRGSQVQNNLELHYLIPGKDPSTDRYNISAAGETINIDKGKSMSGQFGVGYTTVIKNIQQTIQLNLQHERYKLEGQQYRSKTMLLPSVNWLYTKKDHLTKPSKGYRINLNLQGTIDYILSANNFFQVELDTKYLHTFPTHTQILLHAILGYTEIEDINKLPLSLQFYTGGTQSVRGFGYNTIGPGRNLAVGSVELRQKVYGDWYIAGFYDVGNANNDVLKKPNQGVGVGIVWRTAIGALELTFAKAISKPGTPGMIQFSMGPEL